MNYKKLLSYFIIVTMIVLAAVTACEKEKFVPMKIFSIEPAEALIGDTLIINGEGFSPGEDFNDIIFTGLETKFDPIRLTAGNPNGLDNTETRLYVIVPEGAQPGPVTVNLFNEEVVVGPAVNILQPVVESIDPLTAFPNDTVTIRGQHFQPVAVRNSVRFSDTNGSAGRISATVVGGSPGVLRVLVPINNAGTGPIAVAGVAGAQTFTVKGPSITRIAPLQGIVGDTLTIDGFGFADNASARFKTSTGSEETAFALPGSTSRRLKVLVPSTAADGAITVLSGNLTMVSESIFTVFPSVTGINPVSAAIGQQITVSGFGFSTVVSENDLRLSGKVLKLETNPANLRPTPTQMRFNVPAGSVSGPVTLSVNGRVAIGSPAFEVAAAGTPVILEINPVSGPVGSIVVVKGDFFDPTPASNDVRFGGNVRGEVTVASVQQLSVKVPVDAVTGPITVTKEDKTGTGPVFTISERATPVIESISPNMAPHESNITITGANFGEFQQDVRVEYDGCNVGVDLSIVSFSRTEIVAKLPPRERPIAGGGGATANTPVCEGLVSVTLFGRTSAPRTVTISGTPTLTAISAASGFAGSPITLTGTDFHNIMNKNTVTFSGATSAIATITNLTNSPGSSSLTVTVPNLAAGNYTVSLTAFGNTAATTFPYQITFQPVNWKKVYVAMNDVPVTTGGTGIGLKVEKRSITSPTETVYERTGSNTLRSMVVDVVDVENVAKNKVYYATNTSPPIIGRRNADNSGDEPLYTGSSGILINDLTLDVANGQLYWTEGNAIRRMAAAGGTATTLYTTPVTGPAPNIQAIAYEANKLYFFERGGTVAPNANGNLVSISTDILNPNRDVLFPNQVAPIDLKVDAGEGKLFFSNRTNIRWCNLDKTGLPVAYLPFGGTVTTGPAGPGGAGRIAGISLDVVDKYVYFLAIPGNTAPAALGADGVGVYRMRYDPNAPLEAGGTAKAEKIYGITGGTEPLGNGNGFAAGLAVENAGGASQRMRMALTLEMMFTEDE
jgi:hypothetical protein